MINWVLSKIIGTQNEREIKRLRPLVEKINSFEPEVQKLSDAELSEKTGQFKKRLQDGETLDDVLPEAFSVVREVAKRTINMRHFDVQLIGGIVLHQDQRDGYRRRKNSCGDIACLFKCIERQGRAHYYSERLPGAKG